MSISHSDVGQDLRTIVLSGRLDAAGTDSIAPRLVELTAAPMKGVVIDLTTLKFLASIGIRALIASAKAVRQRGGKVALVVGGNSMVKMSLVATGVDQLIPVFDDFSDAERAAAS